VQLNVIFNIAVTIMAHPSLLRSSMRFSDIE
jgi:hypothetical protein